MRARLVIFDFDGTLADTFPLFLRITNDLAPEFNYSRIEEHEVDALRGSSAREMMGRLGVPRWRLPVIVRAMRARMADEVAGIELFPGVGDMLRRLAEGGVALAVVTSNTEATVRRVLGPANEALVGYYECGASIFGKRPKLRRVLRRSGVQAGDALCVGDEIRDADAAAGEGIAFAGVSWGYTRPDALAACAPIPLFGTAGEIADRLLGGG